MAESEGQHNTIDEKDKEKENIEPFMTFVCGEGDRMSTRSKTRAITEFNIQNWCFVEISLTYGTEALMTLHEMKKAKKITQRRRTVASASLLAVCREPRVGNIQIKEFGSNQSKNELVAAASVESNSSAQDSFSEIEEIANNYVPQPVANDDSVQLNDGPKQVSFDQSHKIEDIVEPSLECNPSSDISAPPLSNTHKTNELSLFYPSKTQDTPFTNKNRRKSTDTANISKLRGIHFIEAVKRRMSAGDRGIDTSVTPNEKKFHQLPIAKPQSLPKTNGVSNAPIYRPSQALVSITTQSVDENDHFM